MCLFSEVHQGANIFQNKYGKLLKFSKHSNSVGAGQGPFCKALNVNKLYAHIEVISEERNK